jgi:hypothetical protein
MASKFYRNQLKEHVTNGRLSKVIPPMSVEFDSCCAYDLLLFLALASVYQSI